MKLLDTKQEKRLAPLSRRGLFTILPAEVAGCFDCARAIACAQQAQDTPVGHTWTEKAEVTWEQMFRFSYQQNLIPLLKTMSDQVGHEEFVRMLKEAGDEVVRKKTAGRPPAVRDLVAFAANMKNVPPLIQHALEAEIVEQTPEAFEYHVKKCL